MSDQHINYDCPFCGSNNTALVSLVYKQGHATGNTVTRELIGYDVTKETTTYNNMYGESLKKEVKTSSTPVYGDVSHKTKAFTDLAREIAPPEPPSKPSPIGAGCFMMTVMVISAFVLGIYVDSKIASFFQWGKSFDITVLYVIVTGLFLMYMFAISFERIWWIIIRRKSKFEKAMIEYNREFDEYKQKYAAWEQRFICMRCGKQYYIE